jgi:putative oxidoreductase
MLSRLEWLTLIEETCPMPLETHSPGVHPGSLEARLASHGHGALAVLRIGAGLLFMQHGAQKLFGAMGGIDGQGQAVSLASLMGVAGVLEFFGGLLIVLGLFTRPVAFLLAGEMLVAFFKAHAPKGGFPLENGGELALLYLVVWLTLVVFGAGAFSLDNMRARKAS